MKYLNTKTQAVIETACVISGKYWVQVEDKQPEIAAPKKQSKQAKKSGE